MSSAEFLTHMLSVKVQVVCIKMPHALLQEHFEMVYIYFTHQNTSREVETTRFYG